MRHAASKQRCEAIDRERSRRKEAEEAAKLQQEARQVLASPEAWDDLESLEALDGLKEEDRASIKRAKACVAAILKHLASARKAATEEAFTEARRGLTEQLALLKGRKCGLLTETSAAGRAASEFYSLPMLASNIEDEPNNTTRFLVLGRQSVPATGADMTSILVAIRNRPGMLHRLLTPAAEAGVDLARIESRPSLRQAWDYNFFIDIEGHVDEPRVRQVLDAIESEAAFLKVLGSYPRSVGFGAGSP